ncbi:MAG: hypothetical protein NTW21_44865 [Verrucomicrobia bacterium]|nr:hypothetical protein [Verrucomicrobiota bacterium]
MKPLAVAPNTLTPIVGALPVKLALVSPPHPSNAPSPRVATLAGTVRRVRRVSPQFLIPAENELALVGVSDEFVNHPRMGFRVAEVPMPCHVFLLLDH